jgi:hypothetical protein
VETATPALEGERTNPYLGPRPFAQADAYRFFGRDNEVADLYSLVAAHRTVLLYAQSGAGKTSLLNAGLIPMLEKGSFDVLPTARVSGPAGAGHTEGAPINVYSANAALLWVPLIEPRTIEDEQALLEPVRDVLKDAFPFARALGTPVLPAGFTLAEALKARPRKTDAGGEPRPRVAIFDQFEEFFTAYPERWKDRRGFFEQLDDAMSADPSLRVLFAMREDFVAHIDPYEDLLPEEFRTRYRLEQLREDAALAAVQKPLEGTGIRFAPGVAGQLVSDLLRTPVSSPERMGSDNSSASEKSTNYGEGEFVEPVQLQVVCFSLFRNLPPRTEEITDRQLTQFGDVDQALREFYQDSLKEAAAKAKIEEDSLRQWFERNLITEAGTRGLVFRGENTTGGIPNKAVDALEELHIIRAEVRGGDRWYELSHDRFIQPVLRANDAWRTRVQEAERRRQEEENRRALEQERAEAAKSKQQAEEQHRQAERFRHVIWALVAMLLLAIATIVYAFAQRAGAKANEAKAAMSQKAAADRADKLEQMRSQVLRQYGWTTKRIADAEKIPGSPIIAESLHAGQELLNLPPPTSKLSIGYYHKEADAKDSIDELMRYWKSLGYEPSQLPGVNAEPTNVVWFRGPVTVPDLKRIALGLIRAGIRLHAIKNVGEGQPKVVIGYDIEFDAHPPWTVDEAVARHDFMSARHTNLFYVAVPSPSAAEADEAYRVLGSRGVDYTTTVGRKQTIATHLMGRAEAESIRQPLEAAHVRCEIREP